MSSQIMCDQSVLCKVMLFWPPQLPCLLVGGSWGLVAAALLRMEAWLRRMLGQQTRTVGKMRVAPARMGCSDRCRGSMLTHRECQVGAAAAAHKCS